METKKDLTLSGKTAYDNETDQPVLILYTWEDVCADGTITSVQVLGKKDFKLYVTDFRNLSNIEQ